MSTHKARQYQYWELSLCLPSPCSSMWLAGCATYTGRMRRSDSLHSIMHSKINITEDRHMGQKKKHLKSFLVQGRKKIPKVISSFEDTCAPVFVVTLCKHSFDQKSLFDMIETWQRSPSVLIKLDSHSEPVATHPYFPCKNPSTLIFATCSTVLNVP